MSSSSPTIYCPNPACPDPGNQLGESFCAACQTPLLYRHLWAVGSAAARIPTGQSMGDRYWTVAPQIWLDTKPAEPPLLPEEPAEEIAPYLRLYPRKLHIPQAYGFCPGAEDPKGRMVLLLENVPVDARTGQLYPAMLEAWPTATGARQVYWLWQILSLWAPLAEMGVASSLLKADNIRVQGWRVWLRELYGDAQLITKPDLQDLGYNWLTWTGTGTGALSDRLQEIGKQMRRPDANLEAITEKLNRLLLEVAAQLPLGLRVAGATDTGKRDHNEDSCYPTREDLPKPGQRKQDPLMGRLAIVCDGVGGHEGGEVASRLALQTIKLAVKALLNEFASESEISPPKDVMGQLAAIARIANNTIAQQNDAQGRSSRQRMGTTLVMALQLPQKIQETANSHELYLVNVGDSRAYWLTADYCQQLTIDDDVATREVRLGHSFYRLALQRQDAGALTGALGTKDGEFLRVNIQRLIIEEDGLLLLCSDGLSDNDLVEKSWPDFAPAVLANELSLEDAVEGLIELGNEKNGHDNISAVLMRCRVSPEKLVLFDPNQLPDIGLLEEEMSEASLALLYGDEDEDNQEQQAAPSATPEPDSPQQSRAPRRKTPLWVTTLKLLAVVLVSGTVGFLTFWQLAPESVDRLRDRFFPPEDSGKL